MIKNRKVKSVHRFYEATNNFVVVADDWGDPAIRFDASGFPEDYITVERPETMKTKPTLFVSEEEAEHAILAAYDAGSTAPEDYFSVMSYSDWQDLQVKARKNVDARTNSKAFTDLKNALKEYVLEYIEVAGNSTSREFACIFEEDEEDWEELNDVLLRDKTLMFDTPIALLAKNHILSTFGDASMWKIPTEDDVARTKRYSKLNDAAKRRNSGDLEEGAFKKAAVGALGGLALMGAGFLGGAKTAKAGVDVNQSIEQVKSDTTSKVKTFKDKVVSKGSDMKAKVSKQANDLRNDVSQKSKDLKTSVSKRVSDISKTAKNALYGDRCDVGDEELEEGKLKKILTGALAGLALGSAAVPASAKSATYDSTTRNEYYKSNPEARSAAKSLETELKNQGCSKTKITVDQNKDGSYSYKIDCELPTMETDKETTHSPAYKKITRITKKGRHNGVTIEKAENSGLSKKEKAEINAKYSHTTNMKTGAVLYYLA